MQWPAEAKGRGVLARELDIPRSLLRKCELCPQRVSVPLANVGRLQFRWAEEADAAIFAQIEAPI